MSVLVYEHRIILPVLIDSINSGINISPLLNPHHSTSQELPSPNLKPRHRDLIATPCGPIKPWSELSCLVKLYYFFAVLSLMTVMAVTVWNIYNQNKDKAHGEDFTVSLIQLISTFFCCYYITRGVLQENHQELIAFVVSVLVVMIRSIANFIVSQYKENNSLILVRFVCITCVGILHVICSIILICTPNMMSFRVGGALESLQDQYFLLNLSFSLVTFDLQAQICLCILVLSSGLYDISYSHSILLGFGIFWVSLTAAVGVIAVLKEKKVLVWIFLLQSLPELAYLIYLFYLVSLYYANLVNPSVFCHFSNCLSWQHWAQSNNQYQIGHYSMAGHRISSISLVQLRVC
ncbi:uncharacterized protein LOC127529044 isoform X2 [Erpetoichthys calabaricus]|uniref:uncharacterized protein LOC127529044 isoform X2 n=1 Tax=Erpetoichthys calabaricus TaxID=27687 RepID=UPI002234E1AD|nr:uncharacterized protein LOC127529044 isoform X2 [Erpetoichthys calabaricus]